MPKIKSHKPLGKMLVVKMKRQPWSLTSTHPQLPGQGKLQESHWIMSEKFRSTPEQHARHRKEARFTWKETVSHSLFPAKTLLIIIAICNWLKIKPLNPQIFIYFNKDYSFSIDSYVIQSLVWCSVEKEVNLDQSISVSKYLWIMQSESPTDSD